MESDAGKDGSRKRRQTEKGDDTLSNTNKPSAAALIRAQGQQIRREAAWEYLQRRCGLRVMRMEITKELLQGYRSKGMRFWSWITYSKTDGEMRVDRE